LATAFVLTLRGGDGRASDIPTKVAAESVHFTNTLFTFVGAVEIKFIDCDGAFFQRMVVAKIVICARQKHAQSGEDVILAQLQLPIYICIRDDNEMGGFDAWIHPGDGSTVINGDVNGKKPAVGDGGVF
jgi:hypothetical protein